MDGNLLGRVQELSFRTKVFFLKQNLELLWTFKNWQYFFKISPSGLFSDFSTQFYSPKQTYFSIAIPISGI